MYKKRSYFTAIFAEKQECDLKLHIRMRGKICKTLETGIKTNVTNDDERYATYRFVSGYSRRLNFKSINI
jgi:hypothetical protein